MPLFSDQWEPKEDLLNRDGVADLLIEFMDKYNSAVLSLNSLWGGGKTFFIQKVLRPKLEGKYCTIYLDAFRYDYHSDPFMSIAIGLVKKFKELKEEGKIEKWQYKKFGNAISAIAESGKKKFPQMIADIVPYGIGGAVKHSIEFAQEGIKGYKKTSTTDIEEWLKINDAHTKLIEDFQTVLKEIAKEQRIIFIVDELDRCRPDFAVELMEKIKHIFSVEGIIFLLASNPKQLQESIKHIYGQNINAIEYLQKFYDLQFTLPFPPNSRSCNYTRYIEHYISELKIKDDPQMAELESLSVFIEKIANAANAHLRDLQKFFVLLKYFSDKKEEYEMRALSFLILLKVCDVENFNMILNKTFNPSIYAQNKGTAGKYNIGNMVIGYFFNNYDESNFKNFKNRLRNDFEKKEFIQRLHFKIASTQKTVRELFLDYARKVEHVFEVVE